MTTKCSKLEEAIKALFILSVVCDTFSEDGLVTLEIKSGIHNLYSAFAHSSSRNIANNYFVHPTLHFQFEHCVFSKSVAYV